MEISGLDSAIHPFHITFRRLRYWSHVNIIKCSKWTKRHRREKRIWRLTCWHLYGEVKGGRMTLFQKWLFLSRYPPDILRSWKTDTLIITGSVLLNYWHVFFTLNGLYCENLSAASSASRFGKLVKVMTTGRKCIKTFSSCVCVCVLVCANRWSCWPRVADGHSVWLMVLWNMKVLCQ